MELKHASSSDTAFSFLLLIVPYGIETIVFLVSYDDLDILLIVPYGIETRQRQSFHLAFLAFNRTLWN